MKYKVNIASNGLIEIPDCLLHLLGEDFRDRVRFARCQIRDEARRSTWVYDRFLGLTINDEVNDESNYVI